MKTRMIALMVMMLAGAAFATPPAWLGAALSALMLSLMLLGILYAIAIAFSLQDMKFLATDELYQLIITAVMVALLFSLETTTNEIFAPIAPNLQDAGLQRVDAALQSQLDVFDEVEDYMVDIVPQSTKSQYCGLSGAGFYVSPCGSFSALTPPLTMALQAIALSIAELSSLRTLVAFGGNYAFSLIFPIGILLRALRFTRGAGAIFIGLGVSLYLFVPITAIFMDEMTSTGAPSGLSMPDVDSEECDVHDFSTEAGFSYGNAERAKGHMEALVDRIDDFMFMFLVRGTFFTVGVLVAFYATFRWVSRLAGADVDLMALMKIA
ncbi:MAG: hypothetical protein AB1295_06225 [Candidatus Micrarchaeota archaeon]